MPPWRMKCPVCTSDAVPPGTGCGLSIRPSEECRRIEMRFAMRDTTGRRVRFQCLVLLSTVLCSTFTLGQGIVTGSPSGTVTDPQSAAVQGAKVTAHQDGTNLERITQSNSSGLF